MDAISVKKNTSTDGSHFPQLVPCQTLVRRSEVIFDCQCEIWSDGRADSWISDLTHQ